MPTVIRATEPATAGGSLSELGQTITSARSAGAAGLRRSWARPAVPNAAASETIVQSASRRARRSSASNTVKPVTSSYQSRNRLTRSTIAPTEATQRGPSGM